MTNIQNYKQFLSSFNSPKFQELWPAQKYVLDTYAAEYTAEANLAIELPTGAGKTLITLLISEAWRRENKKVAILSANKTLAKQMASEAEQLRIPFTLMQGSGQTIPTSERRAYRRSQKVAVMNYWVYFNQGPVIDPADLIIMDDAHLAEHCFHSLWSVEIDRFKHESLFKDIVRELVERFPEYKVLHDALDDNSSPNTSPELLSFLDQIAFSSRLEEIVEGSTFYNSESDLHYRWNRMRQNLNEANIYLSINSIWIRPYIYPLISNNYFSAATQRIYMSATIGDQNDLCRRLGVQNMEKMKIPDEFADTTFGRRLVIMNRIDSSDIPDRLYKVLLKVLQNSPKSLWLCNSKIIAEKYKNIVFSWLNDNELTDHPTWMLQSLGNEIEEFKSAAKGHLFVGGRFDGMDFQRDECRLVVLTTLPRAVNVQEAFFSAYLRDASFLIRRLNKRIIQALGRCNRHPEDYAVYILADRGFATHLGLETNRNGISKNIIAEFDMAEDFAEIDIDELLEQVEKFINGNFDEYDRLFNERLEEVPNVSSYNETDDNATDEVIGWDALFSTNNYGLAAEKFKLSWETSDTIELSAFYGWCWAKARYLQGLQGTPGAIEDAYDIFEQAINRGGNSSWFNRMRTSLNRARNQANESQIQNQEYANIVIHTFDDYLEELGNSGTKFETWFNDISTQLQSHSHIAVQSGMKELGLVLGYDSIIPDYDTATDCRWRGVLGNIKEVVIFEAKVEVRDRRQVSACDIGQAHNQLERAKSEYESYGYKIRSVIITPMTEIRSDAEAAAGSIKVINQNTIFEFWQLIKQLFVVYRNHWSLNDIRARNRAADRIRTKIPSPGWLTRALDTDTRFISTDILLAEWRN